MKPGLFYILRSDLTVLEIVNCQPVVHDGCVSLNWSDTWHSTTGRSRATGFVTAEVAGELLDELRSRWPSFRFVLVRFN